MVPADSCRISRVPHYSGAVSHHCLDFGYGAFTLCGPAFQRVLLSLPCLLADGPSTPRLRCHSLGLGSCAFARHYLRNHCCFLFLRVLRCFSSPGLPHTWCGDRFAPVGLPHSEIRASPSICLCARLIAACHVLRRLREPRHPSCALLSFPLAFKEKSPFYAFRLVVDTSLARVI